MIKSLRRAAIAVAAIGTSLVFALPASAAPPGTFEIDYDASGTTHLQSTNSDVALGPTVLKTYISDSGDGTLTGDLPLPETSTTFKALGFLPTTATVNFVPVGQLQGQLSDEVPLTISATTKYYIKLTNVKVGGVPAFVGNHCQTINPVNINVATPAGERFDISDGGTLAGTYSVGLFAHCGLTTPVLNLLVPGSGNTVSFQLSNGRFVE